MSRWLVFHYFPVALFSLKTSRASSTAGKTLLTPTPYSIKMAFLDAALRHDITKDPDSAVRELGKVTVRIGVPKHACVTGTIHKVRQEKPYTERKRNPELPRYTANIAMREFVHFAGTLRLAVDMQTCSRDLADLLQKAAPAVNYFGKRGGFFQYSGVSATDHLDSSFTCPVSGQHSEVSAEGQTGTLDDFGTAASFYNMNSFSSGEIQRGVDRIFVESVVPFRVYNAGPGFVHYCATGVTIEE